MNPKEQAAKDARVEAYRYTDDVRDPQGRLYKYTDKERLFVFHYLETTKFSAAAAVRAAGYNCRGENSDGQMGAAMMRKDHIRTAIDKAFQVLTIPKHETLFRLARIATGSINDLLDDDGQLDIELARKRGSIDIVKKVKIDRRVIETKEVDQDKPDDAEDVLIEKAVIQEKIEFEIHDPLRALELIGKHERLFVDRIESTGKDGKDLIPENAGQVVVYLPDNGRGDAGKPAKGKTK